MDKAKKQDTITLRPYVHHYLLFEDKALSFSLVVVQTHQSSDVSPTHVVLLDLSAVAISGIHLRKAKKSAAAAACVQPITPTCAYNQPTDRNTFNFY